MKNHLISAGVFVLSAVLLFSLALFLIGSRQNTFGHHLNLYTELANVNGLQPGSKVRVSGFDAGKLTDMQPPDRPSGKFRLKLEIDERLHKEIRQDSIATVESDGVVGDKFILISGGRDSTQEANDGYTLPSKAPFDLSAAMEKASGVMDHADATITDLKRTLGDVKGKADGALDAVTATVDNTNGLITGIRQGKGTIGMLLTDQKAAGDVKGAIVGAKQAIGNAQEATAHLDQISVQAQQIVSDFQSRDLLGKAQDTLDNAKSASNNLNQTSEKLNQTMDKALAQDSSGRSGADNIRETLANVNSATANLADDTEALKHEFFFRGFFKRRGFYSLDDLTPSQYRKNSHFQNRRNQRSWLDADDFTTDGTGNASLSVGGEVMIDRAIDLEKDSIWNKPIIVEGYSTQPSVADQIATSKAHAAVVAHYLEKRFHLKANNIGIVPLNATPPPASGKSVWDGACILLLSSAR